MSKAKNRELFNEAIADAKAIKDMAIENAKKAIAESFTPQIHKMLATKLEEMELEETEETELTNEEVESTNESEVEESKKVKSEDDEEKEESNESLNLDELLAELEEGEQVEEETLNEDLDEAKKDDKKDEPKAKKDDEEEEEIDLESMSSEDLEDFIKGVIKDMSASGELEGGDESETEVEDDEEVTIDEILKSLEEGGSTHKPVDKKAVDAKSVEYYEKAHEKVKEELNEALEAVQAVKKEMAEVNLLNSKLLYINKIFKAKNLNESQKVKVLNSFDKAKTVKESKVVYDLLLESLSEKKAPIREHRSTASAVISGANKGTKKPILESIDPQVSRFRKLAGLD